MTLIRSFPSQGVSAECTDGPRRVALDPMTVINALLNKARDLDEQLHQQVRGPINPKMPIYNVLFGLGEGPAAVAVCRASGFGGCFDIDRAGLF